MGLDVCEIHVPPELKNDLEDIKNNIQEAIAVYGNGWTNLHMNAVVTIPETARIKFLTNDSIARIPETVVLK